MRRYVSEVSVLGPWSLATSRSFWEGFAPAALSAQGDDQQLSTVFRVEADWSRAETTVSQHAGTAEVMVSGDGDLEAAAVQVCRFLALDMDGRNWPGVADRDRVMAEAQARLPGLRPCGFHSPYEAAAWAVLSQRLRIVQAARLRDDLVHRHSRDGAFPDPEMLRALELDLPGRKGEYLHAVAEAALEGRLDGTALRSVDPDQAIRNVREINGLGPFAAELVVIRGANAPDVVPHHERRLEAEVIERYGPDAVLDEVAKGWRPYRTWACVHLRTMRELRTHEITRRSSAAM